MHEKSTHLSLTSPFQILQDSGDWKKHAYVLRVYGSLSDQQPWHFFFYYFSPPDDPYQLTRTHTGLGNFQWKSEYKCILGFGFQNAHIHITSRPKPETHLLLGDRNNRTVSWPLVKLLLTCLRQEGILQVPWKDSFDEAYERNNSLLQLGSWGKGQRPENQGASSGGGVQRFYSQYNCLAPHRGYS